MARTMNKSYKIAPPPQSCGRSSRWAHNIERLRDKFFRNCKKTPQKWPKLNFDGRNCMYFVRNCIYKHHVGRSMHLRKTQVCYCTRLVSLYRRETHAMHLKEEQGRNEEDWITHLLIMAKRFEIWTNVIKHTSLSWGSSIRWAHFQLPVGGATYRKSVFPVFLENGKSYE